MGNMNHKRAIRSFLAEKLARKNEQREIKDEENLIAAGIIDSLGIMQLVAFLEESFSMSVKDEDIVPENLESLNAIASYVERTLSE